MKVDRAVRVAIAVGILALFVVIAGGLLFVTDTALSIWERLRAASPLFLWAYAGVLVVLAAGIAWLMFRLLKRRKPAAQPKTRVLTREAIEARLEDAAASGVDTEAARAELQALAASREDGAIRLCFFGEVSSGKSSLVKALVPDADVRIDVVGGSTSEGLPLPLAERCRPPYRTGRRTRYRGSRCDARYGRGRRRAPRPCRAVRL